MANLNRVGPGGSNTNRSPANTLSPAELASTVPLRCHNNSASNQLSLSLPSTLSSGPTSNSSQSHSPLFGFAIPGTSTLSSSDSVVSASSTPQQIPALIHRTITNTNAGVRTTYHSPSGAPIPTDISTAPSLLSSSSSIASSSLLLGSPLLNTTFASAMSNMDMNVNMNMDPSSTSYSYGQIVPNRSRSRSRDDESVAWSPPLSPVMRRGHEQDHDYSSLVHHNLDTVPNNGSSSGVGSIGSSNNQNGNQKQSSTSSMKQTLRSLRKLHRSKKEQVKNRNEAAVCKTLAMNARKENDSMVYLDGPRIYTCGECRTHLTSHDEIISKSFHGRHGRAYLFDHCVNVTIGPAEDRRLMTGLHSVCDIFCKRCKTLVGWTYARAYEPSQKYKEGKFIVEKINLHMEESDYYQVNHPAGERRDRWKMRSMSWGDEGSMNHSRSWGSHSFSSPRDHGEDSASLVYEYQYRPRSRTTSAGSWTSTPNSYHSAGTYAVNNRPLAGTGGEGRLPSAPSLSS